jgi:hypothetical protein
MVQQKGREPTITPRERIARMRSLVRRGWKYWRGSLAVLLLGSVVAVAVASTVQRVYRSECTVFAKPRIRTDDHDDSWMSPEQMARQSARLKDMLTTHGRLESAIKTFHLYPETVAHKTMLDAVEQMKPHVGFRTLEGAQYVISFDGESPDAVEQVTRYLSESLIEDYGAGDLSDLQREADFLAQEEERSLQGLEESTRALTVFLAAHPEFALEAKQAATPFGPSPTAGIPLMPKVPKEAAATSDPELAALYRERSRLEGEARAAAAVAKGVIPPPSSMPSKQLDDQIAQAQTEVEAAAKRVAETQADLASKSNLTEDHPDMRAARMANDAAARQLHEAKVKLAALQQAKVSGTSGAPVDPSQVPPEIADKIRQLDAQIAARRVQSRRGRPADGAELVTTPSMSPGVTAVVKLETEWQRLLRAMNEAKDHHDDLKVRAERAKLAFGAARAQASERMAVVDPPFRPTHPSKGGRTNTAIAGLAMALLVAVAYATARVTLDDALVDASDLEARGYEVLGVLPCLHATTGGTFVRAGA